MIPRIIALFALVAAATTMVSHAADPEMVADLYPAPAPGAAGSAPSAMVVVGDQLYFAATDGRGRRGLWVTDGTAAGTRFVAPVEPLNGVAFNGEFIFAALETPTSNKVRLWRSDGTLAGTRLAFIGSTIEDPEHYHVINGALLFRANGSELWRIDGSYGGNRTKIDTGVGNDFAEIGTDLLYITSFVNLRRSDGGFAPQTVINLPSAGVQNITRAGSSRAYFMGDDGTYGRELWSTDGTSGGTSMVVDIRVGAPDSSPAYLAGTDSGNVYFRANLTTTSKSSFFSDGTAGGTVELTTADPSTDYFVTVGERGYFVPDSQPQGRELWTSDGTAVGTGIVVDIHPDGDSDPQGLFADGGKLYFSAEGGTGRELWVAEGATATRLLDVSACANPRNFVSFNGLVYFTATDQSDAADELWSTDGTTANTRMVFDLRDSLPVGDVPDGVTDGTRLWFAASNGTGGENGLWISDGTAAGTKLVCAVCTNPEQFTPLGDGRCVFAAATRPGHRELWISDGTPAGTRVLDSVGSFDDGIDPRDIVVDDGRVFFIGHYGSDDGLFVCNDSMTGFEALTYANTLGHLLSFDGRLWFVQGEDELWSTDGTVGNTSLQVADDGSSLAVTGTFQGLLYFIQNHRLWATDGSGGTFQISGAYLGSSGGSPGLAVGGLLVFSLFTSSYGIEPWVTDGTDAGTQLLKNLVPGTQGDPIEFVRFDANHALIWQPARETLWITDATAAGTMQLRPRGVFSRPVSYGAQWFFRGNDDSTDNFDVELWVTDGTLPGTGRVHDVADGAMSSDALPIGELSGRLWFGATTHEAGAGLWSTTGGASPTLEKAIGVSDGGGSTIADLTAWTQRAWFTAQRTEFSGRNLWRSDGTDASTIRVTGRDLVQPAAINNLCAFGNGEAGFTTNSGTSSQEVAIADGTAGGVTFHDLDTSGWSNPTDLVALGDQLLLSASVSPYGRELAATDGVGGIAILANLNPSGDGLFTPLDYARLNGNLFFPAYSPDSGTEVALSNGSMLGTAIRVETRADAASGSPQQFVRCGNCVFFTAYDDSGEFTGRTLFFTDGTLLGTGRVAVIDPGGNADIKDLMAGTTRVFFTAVAAGEGRELWVSDGTGAGTQQVTDTVGNWPVSSLDMLGTIGDRLLFVDKTDAHGEDLWVSDGTAAGTVPLDVATGPFGSDPEFMVVAGGLAYFVATTPEFGRELWQTDGTPEGTQLAADICPGPAGSSPQDLIVADNTIWFTATDGVHGRELWRLEVASAPRIRISAGGTPVAGNVIHVPLGSTLADLDLQVIVSHDLELPTSLAANISGMTTEGLIESEFTISPAAAVPAQLAPTSGSFDVPDATIDIELTADDGSVQTVFTLTLQVDKSPTAPTIAVTANGSAVTSGATIYVPAGSTVDDLVLQTTIDDENWQQSVSLSCGLSGVTTETIVDTGFSQNASGVAPLVVDAAGSGAFSVEGADIEVTLTATDDGALQTQFAFTIHVGPPPTAPTLVVQIAGEDVADGDTVKVPFDLTMEDLELEIFVDDVNVGDAVSLTCAIDGASDEGIDSDEFTRSAAPVAYLVQPTSGTFDVAAAEIEFRLTAYDGTHYTSFTFTLKVGAPDRDGKKYALVPCAGGVAGAANAAAWLVLLLALAVIRRLRSSARFRHAATLR